MFKKKVFIFVLAIALLAVGHSYSYAQTAPVGGKVEMVKADGSHEPVANALIEVYRVDINTGFPSGKTNKRGEFNFAGFLFGGEYVLSVSAPGITPKIFPGVKPGNTNILITVNPGDGQKFTEQQVRDAIANKSTAATADGTVDENQLSEEDRRKKAEEDAKIAAIKAKNEKIKEIDTIVNTALKDGNEAFRAKNYDVAIAKFDEGYKADPEFVGSAPVMLNNKGASLVKRAVATYEGIAKETDPAAKAERFKSVKADLAEAASSYATSLKVIKSAKTEDIKDPATTESARQQAIRGGKDAIRIAVQVKQIGEGLAESAGKLLPDYIEIETDQVKKDQARLMIADLYRVDGKSDLAVAAYRSVLEILPDNIDALAGIGLVLVDQGWLEDDKAKSQEGANYLQKFVSLAPDSHELKTGAAEYLKLLKDQNIVPVKAPTKKRG